MRTSNAVRLREVAQPRSTSLPRSSREWNHLAGKVLSRGYISQLWWYALGSTCMLCMGVGSPVDLYATGKFKKEIVQILISIGLRLILTWTGHLSDQEG